MYSPPVGGAARRPSATIDKQNTSNRRFIIYGEEDYLCGNDLWQMVGRDSPSAPDLCRRGADAPSRRNEQPNGPGGGPSPGHPLPFWIDFSPREVVPSLPPPNQCEPIAANQCFCRERTRIIVRGH